ncbi:hypothetical protein ACFLZZ_00085 [Nanoarchaeota archaeon]
MTNHHEVFNRKSGYKGNIIGKFVKENGYPSAVRTPLDTFGLKKEFLTQAFQGHKGFLEDTYRSLMKLKFTYNMCDLLDMKEMLSIAAGFYSSKRPTSVKLDTSKLRNDVSGTKRKVLYPYDILSLYIGGKEPGKKGKSIDSGAAIYNNSRNKVLKTMPGQLQTELDLMEKEMNPYWESKMGLEERVKKIPAKEFAEFRKSLLGKITIYVPENQYFSLMKKNQRKRPMKLEKAPFLPKITKKYGGREEYAEAILDIFRDIYENRPLSKDERAYLDGKLKFKTVSTENSKLPKWYNKKFHYSGNLRELAEKRRLETRSK